MSQMSRGRPGPGGDSDAELDASLSRAWAAAAAAVGRMLDLPAGKEALLASSGMLQERTAGRRAPAGITRQMAHRQRRRRLVLPLAGGLAVALAAGVVALVSAGVPGERNNSTQGPLVSTAYVVRRVDRALGAAGPAEIAQATVITRGPGGTTTTEEWSYGDQSRAVTNSLAGHPAYDQGLSGGSVYTVVSYMMRAWARHHRQAAPVVGSPGCEPGSAVVPLPGPAGRLSSELLSATVVSALRAAISCGTLTVAGRQRVDGVEAIELTGRPGSAFPETIWVRPGTYLPVRVVTSTRTGRGVFGQTADISWLRPTPQNLAKLTVPIPAGFRQEPVAAILRQLRSRAAGQ